MACFASHVHRVQQVLDAAVAHNRKVAYVGRSMIRNMNIARELGYLNVPADTLVDSKEIGDYPPERTVLISTGSQGEPLSALSRIAQRNHNFVHIEEGDTVVLASSLIPGNENAVYRVINGLARWGAHVVHKGNALVHVSGHASAGELLYCYNIVKPRNVLRCTARSGTCRPTPRWRRATGVAGEHVVIAEDGVVVDLMDGKVEVAGKVDCGYVFVDGQSVGDITEASLKDRRILGEEGFVSVDRRRGLRDRQGRRRSRDPRARLRRGRLGLRRDQAADRRRPQRRPRRGHRRQPPAAADDPPGRSAAG